MNLFRITALCAFWFFFSVNLLLWKSFKYRAVNSKSVLLAVLFLAGSWLLSGCRVDMLTVIHDDGSGTVTASLSRPKDDVDFVFQIPEMKGYLDAVIMDFQGQGIKTENMLNGNLEIFTFQRDFLMPDEVYSNSDLLAGQTWFQLDRIQDGVDTIFRYYGELSTKAFYENMENLPYYAADEINKELDAAEFNFSLVLPGEITYTNGLPASGNKLQWEIRRNDVTQIVAESRIAGQPVSNASRLSGDHLIAFTAGILFLLGSVFFLVAMIAFKPKKQKKASEG
jgi:hypothetical protein